MDIAHLRESGALYPIAHVPATYRTNDYERDEEVFMSRDVDAVDRKVYHWTTVNDSRSRGRRRRTGRRDAPLRQSESPWPLFFVPNVVRRSQE